MTNVCVVMCNDFPQAVFAEREMAQIYISAEQSKDERLKESYGGRLYAPKKHYKIYDFPVIE